MAQDRYAEVVAPFVIWHPGDVVVGSAGEELEFLYDIEFGEFGDADALNVVHCGEICCAGSVDEGTCDCGPGGESGCWEEVVGIGSALGGGADRCH